MESIYLHGSEQVQNAACNMQSAAQEMKRAAESISRAFEKHQRFLDDWLARLETAITDAKGEAK